MSRSNYNDDCDNDLALGRWRGMVASASRGKRGQAFFKELLAALDAMPEKRLIKNSLETADGVCAFGALGKAKGIAIDTLDPEEPDDVGRAFGIASCLAAETVYMNDEAGWRITDEERWKLMRDWTAQQIKTP